MAEAHTQDLAVLRADARDHAARVSAHGGASEASEDPTETADADAGRHAARDNGPNRRQAGTGNEHLPSAATTELISVAPRGELGSQRLSDANKLRTVPQAGKTDLVSGRAEPSPSVEPLA